MAQSPPPGTPDDISEQMRPPVPLPPRYRFEHVLGEGGLGVVVKAYDTQLRVPVAIKSIRNDLARADPGRYAYVRARFDREALAGAQVRTSPYVVTVYDQLVDPAGNAFLILEFMPGGTLRDRLAGGPLPIAPTLRLIADTARGLQALHEADIIHRDIKPENLFLAADGRVLVGDLGIVQMGMTFQTRLEYGNPQGHPGTPLYMSPEQATGTGVLMPEADQYSLGCVLFELVTGKRYKGVYADEREARLAALPPAVGALIRRMTAERPEERYRGMGVVLGAIGTIDASAPPVIAVPPVVPPWTAVTPPQPGTGGTWPVNLQPVQPVMERPVMGPPSYPAQGQGPVRRRAVLLGLGGLAVVGAVGGVWAVSHTGDGGPAPAPPTATAKTQATATATRSPGTPTPGPTTTTTRPPAIATPSPASFTPAGSVTDPSNLVTLQYPTGWTAKAASNSRTSVVIADAPEDIAVEVDGPGNLNLYLVISDTTGTPAQEIQTVRDTNAKSTKYTIVNGSVSTATIGGEAGSMTDYTVNGNVANILWIVNHGAKQFRFVSINTQGRKAELDPIIASTRFLTGASASRVLYTADFSGWPTGDGSSGTSHFSFDASRGEYHLSLSVDDVVSGQFMPEDQSFADFTLEVDGRRAAGPDTGEYGLMFRGQPQGPNDKSRTRYVFLIYLDGRFELLLFNANGTPTTLQSATTTTAINKGSASNHLTVICKGNQITLGINGATVGTYPATIVAPGKVGIAIAADKGVTGMEAAFKNLRVSAAP